MGWGVKEALHRAAISYNSSLKKYGVHQGNGAKTFENWHLWIKVLKYRYLEINNYRGYLNDKSQNASEEYWRKWN